MLRISLGLWPWPNLVSTRVLLSQVIEREGFLFSKPKEAAGRYNKQLNRMLHQHAEEVSAMGQLQALHSHSLRKGGGGKMRQ